MRVTRSIEWETAPEVLEEIKKKKMSELKADKMVAFRLSLFFVFGSLVCFILTINFFILSVFFKKIESIVFLLLVSFTMILELLSCALLVSLIRVNEQAASKSLRELFEVSSSTIFLSKLAWQQQKTRDFQKVFEFSVDKGERDSLSNSKISAAINF